MDRSSSSSTLDRHKDSLTSEKDSNFEDSNSSIHNTEVPSIYTRETCSKFSNFVSSITVEPSVIGIMYVIVAYSMFAKEYIYERLALDYNLTKLERDHSCNATSVNKSDPYYIVQEKVSAETSKWTMYTLATTFVFATFTTILLGSWSDKVGRKVPLLLSYFGLVILILTYIIVINLNLPVPALLFGHIVSGVFGDVGNVLGCSFSYISDITSTSNRTFRMTILEACIGFGGFVASISGGVWLRAQGFRNPFWFILAIAVFSFVYILLRLPATHERRVLKLLRHLCTKQPFVHMYQVLKQRNRDKKRPLNLILFSLCFVLLTITFMGVRDLLVIYEIGLPFCWNAGLVGISLAMSQLCYFISMILVKVFPKFTAELFLVIITSVLTAASTVVLALATSTWMIFLGLFLQLCFNLPIPILRSQVSRLVAKDEMGSVFGLVSCAQNTGSLLATFFFNGVFSATVESALPGATFLIATGLFIVFIPLYWYLYRRTKAILTEPNQNYNRLVNDVD